MIKRQLKQDQEEDISQITSALETQIELKLFHSNLLNETELVMVLCLSLCKLHVPKFV